MQRIRKLSKWIGMVILCLLIAVPVFGAKQGSLLLSNVEQTVMLFRVAKENGVPEAEFAGVVEKLTADDLIPEVGKKFYNHVLDKALTGQLLTPNSDKEVYTPLNEGWYLVCSVGDQAEFAPFLVCVPMTIGDKTVYDIQAEPTVDSPVNPSGPSKPVDPQPNIPQTGAIQWPKYTFLILGAVSILAGLWEVYQGRRKEYE